MAALGSPWHPVQLWAAVCVGLLACLSSALSVQTRGEAAVLLPDPSCKSGQIFPLSNYSVSRHSLAQAWSSYIFMASKSVEA